MPYCLINCRLTWCDMRPVVEFFSWTELHAIASAYTKDITQQLPVLVYQASLPRLKLNTAIPDCWKRLLFSLTALLKGKKVTNKQNKTEPTSYCWKWLNVEVNGIEMWDLSKGKKKHLKEGLLCSRPWTRRGLVSPVLLGGAGWHEGRNKSCGSF